MADDTQQGTPSATGEETSRTAFQGLINGLCSVPAGVWAAVLLLAFTIQALIPLVGDSVTFDETAHIGAGYTYIDRGDFRLNPEHPPLAKIWAALPLILFAEKNVDYTSPAWQRTDQWWFGFEFINGPVNSKTRLDPAKTVIPARIFMLMISILLGVVIFLWARELRGPKCGLFALLLFAFSPTVLAHSYFVTTDAPAALGFVTTLWAFWRYCKKPTVKRSIFLGCVLGIALVLKFSTILLFPLLALILLIKVLKERTTWNNPTTEILNRLLHAITSLILAWIVIWCCYGLRYSATADSRSQLGWSVLRANGGISSRLIGLGRETRVLPEAYLYGLSFAQAHKNRASFLNGELLDSGSWVYFPELFLLKTPPSLLILIVFIAWTALRKGIRGSIDLYFLAVPLIVYFLVAVLFGLNIGHRHLLPLYPLLFILAGMGASFIWDSRWRKGITSFLLVSFTFSSLLVSPHYLSYFTFLIGGPREGWKYYVDSNIDWGQDLGRLKSWMNENEVPEVSLAYFGTADPKAHKIAFKKVFQFSDFRPRESAQLPESGDYLAISVSLLQGMYVEDVRIAEFFGRVRGEMKPVGRAGYSILIYRIP